MQDNDWGISVASHEARVMNAYEYAAGFPVFNACRLTGLYSWDSWQTMEQAISYVRQHRKPVLVHAKVPLLGHHTSGVKKKCAVVQKTLQHMH